VHLLNHSLAAGLKSLSYRFLHVSRYKRQQTRRRNTEPT
jgi:hypothetical protein